MEELEGSAGDARGRADEIELLHLRTNSRLNRGRAGDARGRADEIELLHLRRELVFSDASSQLAENAMLRRSSPFIVHTTVPCSI
jgi:hypothetical protein